MTALDLPYFSHFHQYSLIHFQPHETGLSHQDKGMFGKKGRTRGVARGGKMRWSDILRTQNWGLNYAENGEKVILR